MSKQSPGGGQKLLGANQPNLIAQLLVIFPYQKIPHPGFSFASITISTAQKMEDSLPKCVVVVQRLLDAKQTKLIGLQVVFSGLHEKIGVHH